MDDSSERMSEEERIHGWDLATRIRYLREEVREGRQVTENIKELDSKERELLGMTRLEPDIARVDFEVRDVMEVKGSSGGVFCLRSVEIGNPKARPGAEGVRTISLLGKDQKRENLIDAGHSEPLPSGYRR